MPLPPITEDEYNSLKLKQMADQEARKERLTYHPPDFSALESQLSKLPSSPEGALSSGGASSTPSGAPSATASPEAPTPPSGWTFPVQDYSGKVDLHWGSHSGAADLFAPAGTPVVAAMGGTVTDAGFSKVGGNYVQVQGTDGNQYYYAHLQDTPLVKQGQQIGSGAQLGGVGDTGNAKGTGTHLHFGAGPEILSGTGPAGGAGGGGFDAVSLLRQALANTGGKSVVVAPAAVDPAPIDKSSPQAFLQSAAPYAAQVEAETGIPANIMLGIAANETGYGKSAPGNNFFGIKGANPQTGASFSSPTWEVENGQRVNTTANFRAYDDPAQSFRDFANLLATSPRYQAALDQKGDPAAFIRAVQAAGYATDPQWSSKVLSIAGQVGQTPPHVTSTFPKTAAGTPDYAALERQTQEQATAFAGYQPPPRAPLPTYVPPLRGLGATARGLANDPTLGQSSYDQPYTGPSTLDQFPTSASPEGLYSSQIPQPGGLPAAGPMGPQGPSSPSLGAYQYQPTESSAPEMPSQIPLQGPPAPPDWPAEVSTVTPEQRMVAAPPMGPQGPPTETIRPATNENLSIPPIGPWGGTTLPFGDPRTALQNAMLRAGENPAGGLANQALQGVAGAVQATPPAVNEYLKLAFPTQYGNPEAQYRYQPTEGQIAGTQIPLPEGVQNALSGLMDTRSPGQRAAGVPQTSFPPSISPLQFIPPEGLGLGAAVETVADPLNFIPGPHAGRAAEAVGRGFERAAGIVPREAGIIAERTAADAAVNAARVAGGLAPLPNRLPIGATPAERAAAGYASGIEGIGGRAMGRPGAPPLGVPQTGAGAAVRQAALDQIQNVIQDARASGDTVTELAARRASDDLNQAMRAGAMRGAVAGAVGTQTQAAMTGEEPTWQDYARNVGLATVGGALLGPQTRPLLRAGERLLGSGVMPTPEELNARARAMSEKIAPAEGVDIRDPRRLGLGPGAPVLPGSLEERARQVFDRARAEGRLPTTREMETIPGMAGYVDPATGQVPRAFQGTARSGDDLYAMMQHGGEHRDWYPEYGGYFRNGLVPGHDVENEAETLFAIYSPQRSPDDATSSLVATMTLARRLEAEGKLNLTDLEAAMRVTPGIISNNTHNAAIKVIRGYDEGMVVQPGAPKTTAFSINQWRASHGLYDPQGTSDVWEFRSKGYANPAAAQGNEMSYRATAAVNHELSRHFGWSTDQGQAANWVTAQNILDVHGNPIDQQGNAVATVAEAIDSLRAAQAAGGGIQGTASSGLQSALSRIGPQRLEEMRQAVAERPVVRQSQNMKLSWPGGTTAENRPAQSISPAHIEERAQDVRQRGAVLSIGTKRGGLGAVDLNEIGQAHQKILEAAGYDPETQTFPWLTQMGIRHTVEDPHSHGTWEGSVEPNLRINLIGGSADQGELVASMFGLAWHQDAVGMRFFHPDLEDLGGVQLIDPSQPWSPQQLDQIAAIARQQEIDFELLNDRSGIAFPAYGVVDPESLQGFMQRVYNTVDQAGLDMGKIEDVTGGSHLVWGGGPDGPSYEENLGRLGEQARIAGQPNLLEQNVNLLRDAYDAHAYSPRSGRAGGTGGAPEPGAGAQPGTRAIGAALGASAASTDQNQDQEGRPPGTLLAGAALGALGAPAAIRKARPFFSQMRRLLEEKLPERATIGQIRDILKGVKADEIKWSGIDDYLATAPDRVPRPDLLKYLDENQVQVEEVLKGGENYDTLNAARTAREAHYQAAADFRTQAIQEGQFPADIPSLLNKDWVQDGELSPTLVAARNEVQRTQDEMQRLAKEAEGVKPRYANESYNLPGGEDYQELLLTMPKSADTTPLTLEEFVRQRTGMRIQTMSPAEQSNWQRTYERLQGGRGVDPREGYQGPHWDEPNVLAHVRFNDRTDAQGKKTLFLEEIQSDWHQAGRQQGYGPEGRKFLAVHSPNVGSWDIHTPPNREGETVGAFMGSVKADNPEEALAKFRAQEKAGGRAYILKGLPEGPFQKTWHELAFRRMAQWAAEHGYDQIAWTTGAQQAERWAGDSVDRTKGMAGFYDKMLPDYADRFGKKWGTKVTDTVINAPGEDDMVGSFPYHMEQEPTLGHWAIYDDNNPDGPPNAIFNTRQEAQAALDSVAKQYGQQTVHALPLTDAMKASVTGEGQPLFNVAPPIAGAAGSQAGTEEDTSPQERLARGAAGLGAGLFGGRFARGGFRAGARAGARAASEPPPTQAIADAREAFREAQAQAVKQGKKQYPQQELADLAEAVTRWRAQVEGPKSDPARILRSMDRHPELAQDPAARGRALLSSVYKNHKEEDFAQFMNEIDMGDPVAIANAVKTLGHKSLRDYGGWAWFNGMLSNPAGRIADFVSTGMASGVYPLEKAAAIPFDMAMSLKTGKRTIQAGEIPAEYLGMAHALKDSSRDAGEILQHGFSAQEARADLGVAAREPVQGPLGGFPANAPSRIIRANDAFYGGQHAKATLYADAYRQAKQEGLKGQDLQNRYEELRGHPTDEMVQHAEDVRKERLWQKPNPLTEWLGGARKIPILSETQLPFTMTPVNLAKYAIDRSPLGLASLGIAAKKGDQKGIAEAIARTGMGSAVVYGMYQLAQQDLITGDMPKDAAERDEWQRVGKQPYSFRVGDQWYSYQKAPWAPLMAAGPAAVEAQRHAKAGDEWGILLAATIAAGKSMAELPMMQSLGQTLNALENTERFGESWVEGQARSIVPQFVQAIARGSDQELRNPEGPWEALLSVLPGANTLVPGRQTAFGEPNLRPEGQRGLGVLNPLKPSAVRGNLVEEELNKLHLPSEGYRVQPGTVYRDITVGKENVDLTREESASYQKAAGQMAFAKLYAAMTTDQWKNATPEEQRKFVHNTYAKAREDARKIVIPQLQQRAREQQQQRQQRMAG